MAYLKSFLVILGFSFLGEFLQAFLPLPIPASIYGLVLLTLALMTGLVKLPRVEQTANWLISIFPVLFAAPVVNLLGCWDAIRGQLGAICIVIAVSTLVVFVVSGKLTQWLIDKEEKK